MYLYITQSNVKVGVSSGFIIVSEKSTDAKIKNFPIEKVKSVSIFGKPSLSTSFLREMLERNISVGFYTSDAHYFGRLVNPESTSAAKQRLQAIMTLDDNFCLKMSRNLIASKIANSLSLLRAFDSNLSFNIIETFENLEKSVRNARSIESIMGFEGTAAKNYFAHIASILPDEFKFRVRSTRPPLDPFNSMISLGYSMLYRNMIGAIERHGMNAYFGIMHQDREKHAALASDLMEEWRAIIVDDTVMQLILNGQITPNDFEKSPKNGGCYAKRDSIRKIISAFTLKITISQEYLEYDSNKYSFQHALDLQLYRYYRALESEDPHLYKPVCGTNSDNISNDELEMIKDLAIYEASSQSGTQSSQQSNEHFEEGDYINAENSSKDYKQTVIQKVTKTCENAVRGELHTTMIGCIGSLINAQFAQTEIRQFIDKFCDIWGDNEFQRNNYYRAAQEFERSRVENNKLEVPYVSSIKPVISENIDELLETDCNVEIAFLIHKNVKYSRGDKVKMPFSRFGDYELNTRPLVQNWEEGQLRKKNNLLKCITFGEFEFNTRSNQKCLGRNVLLLDYDADIDDSPFSDKRMHEIYNAAKSISDCVLLLESVSSRENMRKFHLLFLTKKLNKEEYTQSFNLVDKKMHELIGVHSDKSCKDIARTMYVGISYS